MTRDHQGNQKGVEVSPGDSEIESRAVRTKRITPALQDGGKKKKQS